MEYKNNIIFIYGDIAIRLPGAIMGINEHWSYFIRGFSGVACIR